MNIDLRALRASFTKAMKWKLLTENPFKEVSLLRIPERAPLYFAEEDFQKLIAVVRQKWFKELLTVAALSGLRRGELLNLRWQDVDLNRGIIQVQSSDTFQTKGGKRRSLPMHPMVRVILESRMGGSTNGYVFTVAGRQIHGDWVTKLIKKYVIAAGLNPELHFHSLRHTFATWLIQRGVSIYEIQKLLGHSSISVPQIYSHLASNELLEAVINKT